MPRYDLEGRVVLLTGSTGGLGASLARALRGRGALLALLDLDQDRVDQQAADLGGPDVARGWRADVRDLAGLQAATDAAAAHFGRLDVVVANAGVSALEPLESIDPATVERVLDVNLTGVWRTFRAGLPHVRATQGYLLAVSSMAAFVHSPLNGPYVASKAGVWALCDATRLEVRHHGVGVGSVHPTFFPTPMMDEAHDDPAGLALWGGNTGGVFAMVSLEKVVDSIVSGIERRADLVTATRRDAVAARVPGLVRPLVERLGFRGTTVQDAVALATSSRSGASTTD